MFYFFFIYYFHKSSKLKPGFILTDLFFD